MQKLQDMKKEFDFLSILFVEFLNFYLLLKN